MVSQVRIGEFDKRRLRLRLSLFFLALLLPTGFLIWQAYGQLKWEAFHQYRGLAEELTNRIDAGLTGWVATAEARSFADYSFLVVAGKSGTGFLQQSPLSEFPVPDDPPGLLGYFQVGTRGEFSTPLVPPRNNPPETFGISRSEYAQRQALADELRSVLTDNRLVEYRPTVDTELAAIVGSSATLAAGSRQDKDTASVSSRPLVAARQQAESRAKAAASSAPGEVGAGVSRVAEAPRERGLDSQQAFDQLNETRGSAYRGVPGTMTADDAVAEEEGERETGRGRVADLNLDAFYEKKSANLEQTRKARARSDLPAQYPARVTRKEQISVAEPVAQLADQPADESGEPSGLRISTFESEVDPLEFSLLDSGHFVLFRKVWRDGERHIQGMLLDQRRFVDEAISRNFGETALVTMSDLIIAYRDNVLYTAAGGGDEEYVSRAGELDGALLYRNRLSAPFDSLELIYSVNQLPPGPGAGVLGWASLVLGLVFCTGFYALYHTGLSQINLARQQQDFVSAVSHELKTPLTSIRMYGEMLKEGWAAEEKKQLYYEFIYDESERLTRLISNVLQLANITRSDPQIEMRPVAVGEIMAAMESKISSQVQRAGFELVFQRDPDIDSSTVNIDQDCFAQIIINLVDNAIKFSREAAQKRIEVSSRSTADGNVLFCVRDFGPGIPRGQMRKIFDMFYRSESELTRETVGTGIGLAIVHQLCVAMGADVDVLNRDPGAEFRVSIPAHER